MTWLKFLNFIIMKNVSRENSSIWYRKRNKVYVNSEKSLKVKFG